MGFDFSVIVVAHDRKEYIIDAVKSVLSQDYKQGTIQIVVVKAFNDHVIDDFLKQNGIYFIFTDAIPIGAKFYEGLKVSQGDIICLLEDDDIFSKHKLKKLNDIFSKNSDLWLAVNNYKVINGRGEEVNSYFRYSERSSQSIMTDQIFSGPAYDLKTMLMRLSMTFNNSRMSFRSALKPKLMELYPKTSSLVDNLPIIFTILNNKSVAWISEYLSSYRIHDNNASVNFPEDERQNKLKASYCRIETDARIIRDYLVNNDGKFSDYFDLLASYKALKISMIDSNKRKVLQDGLTLFKKLLKKQKSIKMFETSLLSLRIIAFSLAFTVIYLFSEKIGRTIDRRFPM